VRNQRRVLLRLAAVAAVLLVVGVAAASRIESPADRAALARPPAASVITAKVERRVLSDTLVVRGSVVPASRIEVGTPTLQDSMAAVVTGTPAAVGAAVAEGRVVIEISGRPVILLQAPFPMFRDIAPGVTGPDVVHLQAALARLLGQPLADRRGVFGASTQAAVTSLYRRVGHEVVRAEGGGVLVPRGEIAFVPATPARVEARAIVGAIGGEKPLAVLSAGPLSVEATVLPAERELIAVGDSVEVESEALGRKFKAVVRQIGDFRQGTGESGEVAVGGHVVRLSPVGSLKADVVGHDVRITFVAASTSEPTLVVPLAAVTTRVDGADQVLKVGSDVQQVRVVVKAGLTADGYVAVTPVSGELREGDYVVVGQ